MLSATSLTNTSKRYNRHKSTRHFKLQGKITHLKSKNKVKDTTTPTGNVRNQVYRRRKHDAKGAQEIRQGYGGQSQGEDDDAAEKGEDAENGAEVVEDGGDVHF